MKKSKKQKSNQTQKNKTKQKTTPHLSIQLAHIHAGHQAFPDLFGSIPDQVQTGLLQEECKELQMTLQILEKCGGKNNNKKQH